MSLKFQALALLLAASALAPLHAKLPMIDPAVRKAELAKASSLYARQDIPGLRALLESADIIVRCDAATKLGRLGATEALDALRKLDAQYANFACAPSGEFGVAVLLIENPDRDRRRAVLLEVATSPIEQEKYSFSVIQEAGRELSQYEGADLERRLANVNNYGAQYTVLSQRCRKLSQDEAIALCVAVLSQHETPQKAEAAGEVLVAFGPAAMAPVQELQKNIGATENPRRSTIANRCARILSGISSQQQ